MKYELQVNVQKEIDGGLENESQIGGNMHFCFQFGCSFGPFE